MNYNNRCEKERDQRWLSVEDNEDGDIRIIKCLTCGHIQDNIPFSIRDSVEKTLYDACEDDREHDR